MTNTKKCVNFFRKLKLNEFLNTQIKLIAKTSKYFLLLKNLIFCIKCTKIITKRIYIMTHPNCFPCVLNYNSLLFHPYSRFHPVFHLCSHFHLFNITPTVSRPSPHIRFIFIKQLYGKL